MTRDEALGPYHVETSMHFTKVEVDRFKCMSENVRHVIEDNGDTVLDLHVWRVGPGHMSAIVSVATDEVQRNPGFYRTALKRFKGLSHVTSK